MNELLDADVPAPDESVGDSWADELPPFGILVGALAQLQEDIEAENESVEDDDVDQLDEMTLALAIEFEVRSPDAGALAPRVTASTPTQWTETTVLPVFHRLSLHLTRNGDG